MGLHRVKDGKDSTTILFYLKEKENFTIVYFHEGSGPWSYPRGEELQPRIPGQMQPASATGKDGIQSQQRDARKPIAAPSGAKAG
jgi:hypothetical protein